MKNSVTLFLVLIITFQIVDLSAQERRRNKFDTPYGENEAVGKYAELNGIKMYYEEYGTGEPMLVIHGNGATIKSMQNQIEHFKSKYRVIAADSRGHGKSELKTDSLTYKQITNDWDALVDHLKLDSIIILGWSDGGIIGLRMGINKKSKIKKIITMGANLRPDTTAVHSWAPEKVKQNIVKSKKMISKGDTSKDWQLELQLDGLLINQPHISHAKLEKIDIPVLIMAGDRDIIKNEHSDEIFKHLPKGQLCIMPGVNHGAPRNNPILFNQIVERFLSEPFEYMSDK